MRVLQFSDHKKLKFALELNIRISNSDILNMSLPKQLMSQYRLYQIINFQTHVYYYQDLPEF